MSRRTPQLTPPPRRRRALIGLLSDSHGRSAITHRAVQLLLEQGATCLLHLGDVGHIEVIDALAATIPGTGEQVEARLVFGNTDWNLDQLSQYAQGLGVAVDHPIGRLALGEGELVFCHGHEQAVLNQALGEQVRYLCHGHTHRASDHRQGATRVINPGALFRATRHTVALLNTQQDDLTFLSVSDR